MPSSTNACAAGVATQAAPPQGCLAKSLALEVSPAVRPRLEQPQIPGTHPFLGSTVPGKAGVWVVVADKPYEPPASEIARRPEHIPSEAGGPLASTPPDPVTVAPQHLIGAIGTAVVRNDNLDYVPE